MLNEKQTNSTSVQQDLKPEQEHVSFSHVQYFEPDVSYYAITESNLSEAIGVIDSCFELPEEQQAAREIYSDWIEGRHDVFYEFQNEQVELLGYYIYYDGDKASGVSGLYKTPGDNEKAWMGWFGVTPDHQKTNIPDGSVPLSRQMVLHLEEMAALKGFKYLSAYTLDGPTNMRTHKFYERNGFVNCGTFEMNGETERVYQKKLNEKPAQVTENALVDAVRALRRGKREIVNFYEPDRVAACRSLIKSRISSGEVAAIDDFEYCLDLNQKLDGAYYAMAVINDPKYRHRPIAVACGSLSENDILLISYAATASEYAGKGIGRAVVEDFIDHANKESIARDDDPARMIALEASKLSPSFWGGKINCRLVKIVKNDGTEADFQYIQPSMEWDKQSGLPLSEGCDSVMKIKLNGKEFDFPGVGERFMIRTVDGLPPDKDQVMDAVVDFLDSFYFIDERDSFKSDEAYNNYLACRAGIIEAYHSQFSDMKEIKLA